MGILTAKKSALEESWKRESRPPSPGDQCPMYPKAEYPPITSETLVTGMSEGGMGLDAGVERTGRRDPDQPNWLQILDTPFSAPNLVLPGLFGKVFLCVNVQPI